jgi:hypothetical protein
MAWFEESQNGKVSKKKCAEGDDFPNDDDKPDEE